MPTMGWHRNNGNDYDNDDDNGSFSRSCLAIMEQKHCMKCYCKNYHPLTVAKKVLLVQCWKLQSMQSMSNCTLGGRCNREAEATSPIRCHRGAIR